MPRPHDLGQNWLPAGSDRSAFAAVRSAKSILTQPPRPDKDAAAKLL
ncbi:hypothetical protein [Novipirellula caenicola]